MRHTERTPSAAGLRRRAEALLVVTVLLIVLALAWAGGRAAHGATNVSERRIAGPDRYGTAAQIAEATTFPSGGGTFAILARGDAFADALAGAALAGTAKQGFVLLTTGDTLSPAASSAIQTMSIRSVVILGGTAAISSNVENQLMQMGFSETSTPPTLARVQGTSRYATAAAVAEDIGPANVGQLNSAPTAIVATGTNFPDALAVGPMAYVGHYPILLTPPDSLAPEAQKALTDLRIKDVLIPGGTAAVSANVESQIKAMNITTQRFAGATRQDTAQRIAQFEVAAPPSGLGFDPTTVDLARGDSFPDGLAGAPLAGRDDGGKGAPILLTADPNELGSQTQTYLQTFNEPLTTIDVLGGTSAIAQSVVDAAVLAATCTPSSTSTTGAPTSSTSGTSSTASTTAGGGSPPAPCGSGTTTTTSGDSTSSTASNTTGPTTTPPTTEPTGGADRLSIESQNCVSTQCGAVAGQPVTITVTAVQPGGTPATSYGGTVMFSSNDAAAQLPPDSTLTGGTGTFQVTFNTTGSQTVVAADTVTSSIRGSMTFMVF